MRLEGGHGVARGNETTEGMRFGKVQCAVLVDAAAFVRAVLGLTQGKAATVRVIVKDYRAPGMARQATASGGGRMTQLRPPEQSS